MARQQRERGVLDALARSGQLVALVDPAGQPDVYAHLRALAARDEPATRPLVAGPTDGPTAAVFPWLVRVDVGVLAWLGSEPAPDVYTANPFRPDADVAAASDTPDGPPVVAGACGVYVLAAGEWGAPLDLGRVRRVLARLLTVRLPEGDRVHLRLADPIVLPALFGASTADELAAFYGDAILALVVAEPGRDVIDVYTRTLRPVRLPAAVRLLPGPAAVAKPTGLAEAS